MPLSILIVLHDFSLGGTERTALRLARAWARAGAEVTIFCGSEAGPLAPLVGAGVKIAASTTKIDRALGSRLRLARSAAEYLKKNRADVCFIPGNFHWPLVPKIQSIARKSGTMMIVQISADLTNPRRGRLRQAIFDLRMRLLLRRADALVAMSRKAELEADRVVSGKTVKIPLAVVDDDAPPPIVSKAASPIILSAGRLVPEKGFSLLLQAFAKLPNKDARLVIAGSGPEESRLKSQARDLGIEARVTFLGYVKDIRPALDEARLFVLASRFEGYGAVIVEALAAGRAVVITDCTPATEHLKDPSIGLVVPVEDVDELSQAIAAMLAKPPPDPERTAKLVEDHRIGAVAAQYLDLFRRLSEKRS